jgi:prepilin-type N-terminal cleavage/methylation domain-containing protein
MLGRAMKQQVRGYTLVEVLMVVAIISILAMLSAPAYMQFTQKPRASEAVATMTLMRQALRDYKIVHNSYFDMASGDLANDLPTSVSSGLPTPSNAGLKIDVGVVRYFSNAAFSVDATSPVSALFTNPGPVDFIITADGSASVACGSSNCAIDQAKVAAYRLVMDNSGRIFFSTNSGTSWQGY